MDLMRSKREEERQRLEASERTRQLWEDEKKRQELLRTVMENKRRELLARENHIKNTQKVCIAWVRGVDWKTTLSSATVALFVVC